MNYLNSKDIPVHIKSRLLNLINKSKYANFKVKIYDFFALLKNRNH